MKLSKEDVLAFLPHRDPFLFIDSVDNVTFEDERTWETVSQDKLDNLTGGTLFASFFVRPDMDILRGHFPGRPILPGVVQLEMMAQASCFFMHEYLRQKNITKFEVALLGIEKAKFRKPVVPNMQLKIQSHLTKVRGTMMTFDTKLLCEEQMISECSLMAGYKA
ncbi:MAG: hypothetical protein KBD63_03725 [Bacteriovoracaceae bacterium]|nr:hypothetical protein [Bacteriovoracaceae bacterium]